MRRIPLLALGSALLLLLDQWTKGWAVQALSLSLSGLPDEARHLRGRVMTVCGEWLRLRLAGNPGVAGSYLGGLPDGWRVPVLALLALIALAGAVYGYLATERRLTQVALLLVVGGALGNLSDRLRLGYVVDFIQVAWVGRVLPTFNLADVFICVGALMLLPGLARRRWSNVASRPGILYK